MKSKSKWTTIKSDYINNKDISLKAVAEKHKISPSYLMKISAQEHWVDEKKKRWVNAEREALEEVEGSIKDLIVRHAKVARFLQSGGIRRLQKRFKELELKDNSPKLAKQIREMDDRTLISCVSEGLKAERELYPKQMQIEGDVKFQLGEASDELKKAANEALKKDLTKRRRTRRDNRGK